MASGHYPQGGGRYVQALARRQCAGTRIKLAGGELLVRRVVSGIAPERGFEDRPHTAKDGSDPKRVDACGSSGNAAPAAAGAGMKRTPHRD